MKTNREEMGYEEKKSGEAYLHTEKVSAAQISMYLKDCKFPIDKNRLIDCVKSNDAPDHVLSFINRLPEREYTRPTDVEEEFNKIK